MRTTYALALSVVVLLGGSIAARGEFPPVFDLGDVTPELGVTFLGEDRYMLPGISIAAGDLNGDGRLDLAIAAPYPGIDYDHYGSVYIVFGGSAAFRNGFIDFATLAPPDGFQIGAGPGESFFGYNVGSGFDINGDTVDDLLISTDSSGLRGRIYVVFGNRNLALQGSVDVSRLDGSNGFSMTGRAWYDTLGGVPERALATLDYNADGFDDIAVEASGADAPGRPDAGQVYVVFGGPNVGGDGTLAPDDLNGINGFTVNGIGAGTALGQIAAAGDVNGDGIGDLVFGGTSLGPPGREGALTAHVLFGGTPCDENGYIELVDLPGNGGLVLYGASTYQGIGFPYSLGNIDGDSFADIAVREILNGRLFVVRGGSYLNNTPVIDLAEYDGATAFYIYHGYPLLHAVGDIDGDGASDIASSDWGYWKSFVAYGHPGIGADGAFLFPFQPNNSDWFEIWSADPPEPAGVLQGLPDLNGDGIGELWVQAELRRPDGTVGGGGYVIYGQRRFAMGDFDRDRDVDMADFFDFVMCYNGPLRPPAGSCPQGVRADFDDDGDVDLADYAVFAQSYTGAK